MLFRTHVLLGILMFLFLRPFLSGGNEILFFALVLVGSILPDMDEPRSTVARWGGLFGSLTGFIFRHRGILHSLPFALAVCGALALLWKPFYAGGLFLGYTAHLLGDSITPRGVRMLYPFSPQVMRGPVRVGGWAEKIIYGLLIFLIIKEFI